MSQLLQSFLAFFLAVVGILLLRPASLTIGLVDQPGGRKRHEGAVPIVGGLAMFLAFVITSGVNGFLFLQYCYFIAAGLIVLLGFCDDYFGLSPRVRLLLQVVAALVVTSVGGNTLVSLGDLFGNGPLVLGRLSIPFTVFAMVGLMNAINMLDGIDGLAGSLVAVQLLALIVLTAFVHVMFPLFILLSLLMTLSAYLLFNLRLPGRSSAAVFMGDAGSMFLGFTLAWFYVRPSHPPTQLATPMAFLWLCALPAFDIATVMVRRFWLGRPVMSADREHLHCLLKDLGYRDNTIVLWLSFIALLFASVGLLSIYFRVPDYVLLPSYLLVFIAYLFVVRYLHRQKLSNRRALT